jgi:two-component system sensor histidine kinase VicK
MFRSIQWKMGIIYFLLILIAMQVIGVHLLQSLQHYYEDNFASGLQTQGELIGGLLQRYLTETPSEEYIASLVGEFRLETGAEIIILDSHGVVIGASQGRTDMIGKRMAQAEVTRALTGVTGEQIRWDANIEERFMSVATPVAMGDGEVLGVVYLTASLGDIDRILGDIRSFLLNATLLALLFTGVVGTALARTITRPIQAVTAKAALIAAGDFDQRIEIHSNDEIGQLGETFNYLSTRLKANLREIAHQKNKVEAILTYMNDGVLALDPAGTIIHINPTACKMLNLDQQEAIGRSWREIPGLEKLETGLHKVWREGRSYTTQLFISGDVSLVLQVHFTTLPDVEEGISGVVIVFQDITELEKLEAMRREFVANVSHELRTPITTVKSYVETLLDGVLEDEKNARRFLEVVDRETNRMARLVRDLLQLSQIDYEEVKWKKSVLDLADLLQEACRRWQMEVKKKEINLTLDIPPVLPSVLADKDRIEQVVENLLSNAVKFTPEGGNIILSVAEKGEYVCVHIEDSGIGIPREDLPRIFERFYRVDKARSRSMGGTGLGLSIAQQIIHAHGGEITIDSELGAGTKIAFTLPVFPGQQAG